MEKRIELEKRGRNPKNIRELNLDNCRSTSIVGLTDEFKNLESLSLINVGLTSLKGFPNLPNLKKLELSDNRISNGLNLLLLSPKLAYLNLSGNKIRDLETLQPLKEFSNLKNLDLFNNEATAIENYRIKVFNLIPSLKYLDGFDMKEEEADSECEMDYDMEDDVNGNEDESEEDDAVSDEEDDDEEGDEDIGLSAVYNDILEDESDDGSYDGEDAEEEEDDGIFATGEVDDEEEEEAASGAEPVASPTRGKKRKHEEGGEAN